MKYNKNLRLQHINTFHHRIINIQWCTRKLNFIINKIHYKQIFFLIRRYHGCIMNCKNNLYYRMIENIMLIYIFSI